MPAPAHVQRATLDRFIAGWSNWSAAEMVETWTDDCTQVTLPFSLNHPPRTRAQVEVTLPLVQKVVTEYEVSETTTVPACACVMVGCPQPYPGAAGDMKHT
jgi:hypothetical protein